MVMSTGYAGCNHGVTNMDKGILAAIWDMVPAVVAAYNTGQAIEFAMKQHEIAKDYLRISQWWQDYYNAWFRPVEDQELGEAMSLSEAPTYYDTMRGRAQTAGRIKFKNAVNKSVQCTSEYCTGLRQQMLYDTLEQQAKVMTTLTGLGYRNERAHYEKRSDVRWERMLNTAKRGRDLPAQAVNSAALAYGIYGGLGQQAAKGAEGAASAAGYFWNRNDTFYPTLLRSEANGGPSNPQSSLLKPATPAASINAVSGHYAGKGGIAEPLVVQEEDLR